MSVSERHKQCEEAVFSDLYGRGGFDHWYDEIDGVTQEEIREALLAIIAQHFPGRPDDSPTSEESLQVQPLKIGGSRVVSGELVSNSRPANYLTGSCTDSDCRLCATPVGQRVEGEHHAGIPSPQPSEAPDLALEPFPKWEYYLDKQETGMKGLELVFHTVRVVGGDNIARFYDEGIARRVAALPDLEAMISNQSAELSRLRGEVTILKESLTGGLGDAVKYWMDRAQELEMSCENPNNCQIIKVDKRFIPNGAELIEAYETEKGYIILGEPNDIEDEKHPEYHNCDDMGCATFSHVILRIEKGEIGQLRKRVAALEEQLAAEFKRQHEESGE